MTKYNKALVAVLTAIIICINTFTDHELPVDPGTINALAAFIGSFLVYLIPNKETA